MLLTFKTYKIQYDMIIKSLKTTKKIILGDWSVIGDILSENIFGKNRESILIDDKEKINKEMIMMRDEVCSVFKNVNMEEILNPELKYIKSLLHKFNSIKIIKTDDMISFEIYITDKELRILKYAMDLHIRIALGQIEETARWICGNSTEKIEKFYDYVFLSEEERRAISLHLTNIANPKFKNSENYIFRSTGVSFGIFSKEVNDDIRKLYDVYKVLMFESGCGGVYGYKPSKSSNELDKLPMIYFPIKDAMTFKGEDEYFLDFVQNAKYHKDDDKIYLPYDENLSILLEYGDKIFKKYNNWFVIEKKFGKRYGD